MNKYEIALENIRLQSDIFDNECKLLQELITTPTADDIIKKLNKKNIGKSFKGKWGYKDNIFYKIEKGNDRIYLSFGKGLEIISIVDLEMAYDIITFFYESEDK